MGDRWKRFVHTIRNQDHTRAVRTDAPPVDIRESTATKPMTATDHSSNPDRVRVLVVEDETDLADLYEAWLSDEYDVRTSYGGGEALEDLDASVDVVLLDRRMPGLSGDDVLEKIREDGLGCRVVIVSAVTPDFDVIGMGFDDYLTKPVTKEKLRDAVERMLVRTEYDQSMQELLQLVATRSALESQKSDAELQASDDYVELRDRISTIQSEADAALAEFEHEDFKAAFRDLDV